MPLQYNDSMDQAGKAKRSREIKNNYISFKKKVSNLRSKKFEKLIEFRKLVDEEKLKKLRGLS